MFISLRVPGVPGSSRKSNPMECQFENYRNADFLNLQIAISLLSRSNPCSSADKFAAMNFLTTINFVNSAFFLLDFCNLL